MLCDGVLKMRLHWRTARRAARAAPRATYVRRPHPPTHPPTHTHARTRTHKRTQHTTAPAGRRVCARRARRVVPNCLVHNARLIHNVKVVDPLVQRPRIAAVAPWSARETRDAAAADPAPCVPQSNMSQLNIYSGAILISGLLQTPIHHAPGAHPRATVAPAPAAARADAEAVAEGRSGAERPARTAVVRLVLVPV